MLLCADDLAELIYRMFDDWTAESEIFHVPNVFDFTYGDLADAISAAFPGLSVTFWRRQTPTLPSRRSCAAIALWLVAAIFAQTGSSPCASALERSACSGTIQEAPGLGFSTQPFKTMDRNRNLIAFILEELLRTAVQGNSQLGTVDLRLFFVVIVARCTD